MAPHTNEPTPPSAAATTPENAQASAGASADDSGLFTADERAAIKASWDTVVAAPTPDEAKAKRNAMGQAYIEQVLHDHPHLAYMFPFARGENAGKPDPRRLQVHGAKVLAVVDVMTGMISRSEDEALVKAVDDLVTRHFKYNVEFEHYDAVLGVLASMVSTTLTPLSKWGDVEAAGWGKVVAAIKGRAAKAYAERQAAPQQA